MRKKITHGFSVGSQELLDSAKERAKSLDISFSKYVQQLIKKDLGRPNLFDAFQNEIKK